MGVANGKCETARQGFFFASPRHLNFLDCKTETSKGFEYKTLNLAKNRDSETPSHKKRDCKTCKIRLKFCETQSFWRTIRHPFKQANKNFCVMYILRNVFKHVWQTLTNSKHKLIEAFLIYWFQFVPQSQCKIHNIYKLPPRLRYFELATKNEKWVFGSI